MFCVDSREGVIFSVRVIPRARKTEIAGTRDHALLVRIAAPPIEGAANDAMIALLAERFAVPRSAIRIASGARGRLKRVAIAGLTAAFVNARLRSARL